jgi:hypothetical protein
MTNSGVSTFYTRYISYLTIPVSLFIMFPFIYLYNTLKENSKVFILILLTTITFATYNYAGLKQRIDFTLYGSFANVWTRESRDEFADFVLKNNAHVYFYDYFCFSMPNTIDSHVTPFRKLDELPATLGNNEYIGYALYTISSKDEYNAMKKSLDKKYGVVKFFGNPKANFEAGDGSSQYNPSIVLLR